MTTKYINGSYANGYAAGAGVSLLNIGPSAEIDGAGVSGTGTKPITVSNLGNIEADVAHDGVRLIGGGMVVNRDSGAMAGDICGYHGVDISGGSGRIVNLGGTIGSMTVISGTTSRREASIVLEAGGSVTNSLGGIIASRIDISGGAGNVANNGAIDGEYLFTSGSGGQIDLKTGPSVMLKGGGMVTNGLGNYAAILNGGVEITGGAGRVVNAGIIVGCSEISNGNTTSQCASPSVAMSEGGSVTNQSTGNLLNGVSIAGAGTITNLGQIGAGRRGSGPNGSYLYRNDSIDLGQGTVVNGSELNMTAVICNGLVAVSVTDGAGRVTNFGSIAGVENDESAGEIRFTGGIRLSAGGIVANGSSTDHAARISGYDGGVYVAGGTASITNFGSIFQREPLNDQEDPSDGEGCVAMAAGGYLMNGSRTDPSAEIFGVIGVNFHGVGAITNYGSIVGALYAVYLRGASEKLIEEGCGALSGVVVGGGGSLILDNKAGAGTLAGLGSTIGGFANLEVAAGATWALTGANTVAATTSLRNDGQLSVAQGAALTLASGIHGSGVLALDANSTAEIKGAVSGTETVRFSGNDAKLTLDTPANFRGVVSNLGGQGTDALELMGFGDGSSFSYAPNGAATGGILTAKDGAKEAQINLLGQFVAAGFHEAVSASCSVITYLPQAQMVDLAARA